MQTNRDWKYNFILYNAGTGDRWQMYGKLKELPNVKLCKGGLPCNNPLLNKIHRVHWSAKINNAVHLPFKKIWFKHMTQGGFDNNLPICFVSFSGLYFNTEHKLIDYIKSINPENKTVVHYRDLVKDPLNLKAAKSKLDLVTSFDKDNAKEHDIVYMDHYAYGRLADTTEPQDFKYDLYFVGYAKNRLGLLYDIYDAAVSNGVRCCFKLAGVPKNERRKNTDIIYLEKKVPYTKIIDNIQESRCILEIEQENATGPTMRTFEAITYKRKLLTNRINSAEKKHFNDEQISEIHSVKDIDFEFLKTPIPYEKLKNVDDFSPVKELEFFEDFLLAQNK